MSVGLDASTETTLVFDELYRDGAEWEFRAVVQCDPSGLAGIVTHYGVSLG